MNKKIRTVTLRLCLLAVICSCIIVSLNDKVSKQEAGEKPENTKMVSKVSNEKNNSPEKKYEITDVEFWLNKLQDGKKVILNDKQINNFNEENRKKVPQIIDLEKLGDNVKGDVLKSYIEFYKLPVSTRYDDKGKTITKAFYNSLIANVNISQIKSVNEIKYGMAIRKTSVRSFPTSVGIYDSRGNTNIDRFQETSLEPGQDAAVLFTSKDKKWYFIQMYNYRGWINAEDLALDVDKNNIFSYIDSDKFLVVTDSHLKLKNSSSEWVNYSMGDTIKLIKLPSNSDNRYQVLIPEKGPEGNLKFSYSYIDSAEGVHVGWMDYTRENILRQAFRLEGEKYDWGNKYTGWDCSSYIMSIYKCFGFILPRNTDEQEDGYGKSIKIKPGDSLNVRRQIFDSVKPGAAIFMNGHTMLYVGKVDGIPYMIHDFVGFDKKQGDTYVFAPVNQVAVTSSEISLSPDKTFIMKFTSVLQIE